MLQFDEEQQQTSRQATEFAPYLGDFVPKDFV